MPSKSPAQAASAHTKGGFGGVPQNVGKEINSADKQKKIIRALRKLKGAKQ